MALSGSHTGTKVSGYSLRIDWSATQNIASNTSTITAKAYVIIDSGWSIQIGERTGAINIDGTNYTITYTLGAKGAGTYEIGTASKTITHNADGIRSFAISGNAQINANITGYGWVGTLYKGSNTYTLDSIGRASKPTLNYSTRGIGSSITISTNRASSSFTHTLTYSFGTQSGTIGTAKGVGTSQSWTLPTSLANAIPNSRSGTGTITCTTYNGNTLIGTGSVSFTATVPDNSTFQPTANVPTVVEGGSIPSGITGFIQNQSRAKVTSTGTGKNNATIKTYSVSVANIGTYSGSNITSATLQNSGDVRVTLTVTDSRGLKGSAYRDIKVVAYSPPRLTIDALRNQTNPANIEVSFEGSISPLNNQNYKYFRIRSKPSDGGWFKETDSTQSYTFGGTQIVTSDPDKSYTIELFVEDSFNSVTRTVQIGTGFTLMDFHEDGRAMAIGKVSEDNFFEVGMPTTIFTDEPNLLTLKRSHPFESNVNVNLVFENDFQTRYLTFKETGRPAWADVANVNQFGYDFWTTENLSSSSREIKKDIENTNHQENYDVYKGLKVYDFNLKDEYDEKKTREKDHIGLITDEVPDFLTDKDQSYIKVYDLLSLTVSTLQTTIKKVETLELKVEDLENEIEKLRGGNQID